MPLPSFVQYTNEQHTTQLAYDSGQMSAPSRSKSSVSVRHTLVQVVSSVSSTAAAAAPSPSSFARCLTYYSHQSRIGRMIFIACILTIIALLSPSSAPCSSSLSSSSSSSCPSSSSSFLGLPGVLAASQYPGLPLPIDSVMQCCKFQSRLPVDKLIFIVGTEMYEYDFITQQAVYLYDTMSQFVPPIGAGIEITNPATFGNFTTATYWSNEIPYFFAATNYWKWFAYSPTQAPMSQGVIDSGWMPNIDNMDGWMTINKSFSYAFVGTQVFGYSNWLDSADRSTAYPVNISALFNGLPNSIDDIEFHPNRLSWQVFKDDSLFLYSPVKNALLPGYPRTIHNDSFDGGVNGMNRVRCSGIMELSSAIGFVEDKSPTAALRALAYGSNLDCEWHIEIPSKLLQSGLRPGISWRVDRFDLGSGASLEIAELRDLPAAENIVRADILTAPPNLEFNTGGYARDNAVLPATANPTVLATYTSTNAPLPTQVFSTSSESMTLRVRFRTTTDVGYQGTGFSLKFMVNTPTVDTYTGTAGVIWFSSLGMDAGGTNRTVLVQPKNVLTYGPIWFSFRFNQYPLLSQNYNAVSVMARSALTNASIANCTGKSMYTDGFASPRCEFLTTADQGPIILEYYSAPGIHSNVMAEYYAYANCYNYNISVFMLPNLVGTFDSGNQNEFLRPYQDCSWQVVSPSAFTALFVTFQFQYLSFATESDTFPQNSKFAPPLTNGWSKSDPRMMFYEGAQQQYSTYNVTVYQPHPGDLPAIRIPGGVMGIRFQTGSQFVRGFSGTYKVHFTPTLNSIRLTNFHTFNSSTVMQQLATINSIASAMVYADGIARQVFMNASDITGDNVDFQFEGPFTVYFRWFPIALVQQHPDVVELLTYYPSPLSGTNAAFWQTNNFTNVTDAMIASVTEFQATAGSFSVVAPTRAGDYNVRLTFVLRPSGVPVSNAEWGNSSRWEDDCYVQLLSSDIIHVAPLKAAPFASSIYATPNMVFNRTDAVSYAVTLDSLQHVASNSLNVTLNAGGSGVNGVTEAGRPFQFVVILRDQYGNLMEGFTDSDVRAFLSNDQTSPTLVVDQLMPCFFLYQVTATIATQYELVVLVSGSDVFEGPFAPVVKPSSSDASHSELLVQSTGASLLGSSLPLGQTVNLLFQARDRFGNLQREQEGDMDNVTITWPAHSVDSVSHNGSDWIFQVHTGMSYESSLLSVQINGVDLGYDPNDPLTEGYDQGFPITIGVREIVYHRTSLATTVTFSILAAICMSIMIAMMIGLFTYRGLGVVMASSPPFLGAMLLGALCIYASVIPMVMPEATVGSCALTPLLGHFGFFALFGSLFVKSQRVGTIFSKNAQTIPTVSDLTLVVRLSIIQGLFLTYYAVWMGVSQPMPIEIVDGFDSYSACSNKYTIFKIIPLVVEALFVAYGARLAVNIWNIPTMFNESRYLLIAIGNVAVIGGFFTALVTVILTSPLVQTLFLASGVLIVTTLVVGAMFVPKIYSMLTSATGFSEVGAAGRVQQIHGSHPLTPHTGVAGAAPVSPIRGIALPDGLALTKSGDSSAMHAQEQRPYPWPRAISPGGVMSRVADESAVPGPNLPVGAPDFQTVQDIVQQQIQMQPDQAIYSGAPTSTEQMLQQAALQMKIHATLQQNNLNLSGQNSSLASEDMQNAPSSIYDQNSPQEPIGGRTGSTPTEMSHTRNQHPRELVGVRNHLRIESPSGLQISPNSNAPQPMLSPKSPSSNRNVSSPDTSMQLPGATVPQTVTVPAVLKMSSLGMTESELIAMSREAQLQDEDAALYNYSSANNSMIPTQPPPRA